MRSRLDVERFAKVHGLHEASRLPGERAATALRMVVLARKAGMSVAEAQREIGKGLPFLARSQRFSQYQVRLWIVAGLGGTSLPAGVEPSPFAMRMQRLVERYVIEPRHRQQLAAWARAQAFPADRDLSFRAACREWRWDRRGALENVDDAIEVVWMMMNLPDEGRTERDTLSA